ncbi:serine/threonine-protein kinase [Nocardia concava]|uniref:serine/threonine-protein kinase n=1 Tax=Nocardia concava TaxID=257281 RepID=UPI00030CE827|nr:serine/threonine-protein kinase [Nocardia concava]
MRQPLAAGDPVAIGRYRTLAKLGAGGMGRVLLGAGPDGRLVAIKQIHAHLMDEREYRARFRREVIASTRVSGAFTAAVIDFDVDGDPPWLASAFVAGIPLDQAVHDYGPLPVPAVRALAVGLAVALGDIHHAGLVHRDLKPANVILAPDGPRVIDFGIAQLTEARSGLTETGSALGSPAYMSPEQALSQPITPASDIFSLGSLLVMAVTGRAPFTAASMAYTLFNIVHTEPDLSGVPPQLRPWIAACLHKDPHRRPTPGQLLDYLGRLADGVAPWPPPVRDAIQRQATELAGITASPDATLVVSRSGTGTGFAARPGTVAEERTRRKRRIGVGAAVVSIVAAVAAGSALLVYPEGAGHHTAPAPTLAQLRNADVCEWARRSLPAEVPSDSTMSPDPTTWVWQTSENFGCSVGSGNEFLSIHAGESTTLATTATGAMVDGFPLLADSGSMIGVGCYRGVDLSGSGQHWGILFQVEDSADCGFAQEILSRMVMSRHAIPTQSDPASAATLDACELITREQLSALIGQLPERPATVTAHSCEWKGAATVTTRLLKWDKTYGKYSSTVDLGDGLQGLANNADESDAATSCALDYPYRTVGADREMLEVMISGKPVGSSSVCATAKAVMKAEVARLPKVK